MNGMNGMIWINGMQSRVQRWRCAPSRVVIPFIPSIPSIPLMLSLPLLACQLTEVTVPLGEPQVVVHAILDPGQSDQFVIVERSINGEVSSGFRSDEIPPDGPERGIADARVVLEYPAGTNCGPRADTLVADPARPGLYGVTMRCAPAPGDAVGLRVVTPDGVTVTGTTTIPGAGAVQATVRDSVVGGIVSLNQDRDTLRLLVEAMRARGMLVEVRESDTAASDDLAFYTITDGAALTLAADLVNPFEEDEGEMVFRAGFVYRLIVALADTNYYDFVRSFSDPFTGRGFINHLSGGIGVFGSAATREFRLSITSDLDDPREGRYVVNGRVGARDVALSLDLYLDQRPRGRFGGMAGGTWHGEPGEAQASGQFGVDTGTEDQFSLSFVWPGPDGESWRWSLRGQRAARGTPFVVQAEGFGDDTSVVGTVTMVQETGGTR
jgi:hypothetical protein